MPMTATSSKSSQSPEPKLGEPFCSNCGHRLTGLVDSSKCPECGRPIIEVLTRRAVRGRRYRSETTLFGLPLVEIAFGPSDTETYGRAQAVFAFGDKARGLVAFGGISTGIVAFGGRAVGLFAFGGISIGLIGSWGGMALGALASGGLALGGFAFGGAAAGFGASGGVSAGYIAMGGAPFGVHCLGPGQSDQPAIDFLIANSWFFGPGTLGLWSFIQPLIVIVGLAAAVSMIIALLAIAAHMRASRRTAPAR